MPTTRHELHDDMQNHFTIRTNYHWRELVEFVNLPDAAREWFDYVDDDDERWTPRFVEYRGSWYDTHEYMSTNYMSTNQLLPSKHPLDAWDAYQSDSFYSGTALRWLDDARALDLDLEPWSYVQIASYWT